MGTEHALFAKEQNRGTNGSPGRPENSIIKGGDGKFHMVWTVSWEEKGIGYANSEDLINWSEQVFIQRIFMWRGNINILRKVKWRFHVGAELLKVSYILSLLIMVLKSSLSSGINCAGNVFIYFKTAHLRLAYKC